MCKLSKTVAVLLIAVSMLVSFAVGQDTQVMASTQTDRNKGIPETVNDHESPFFISNNFF